MLINILTHTPVYVWAILALLVYRGVIAARDREVGVRKLYIIPLLMLALSLQGVLAKFGAAVLPLAAWSHARRRNDAADLALRQGARVGRCHCLGMVRVQGSWAPMVMMMVIFFAKYALAVALAIQPQAADNAVFAATACALFGVFSGYFLGCLARDMGAIPRTGKLRQAAIEPSMP
ncbi:hypothetical protein LP419_05815 [Massilia sp. H-1]|nr:hypothetical protein LP419_05815 [Massilia sp. H-1]